MNNKKHAHIIVYMHMSNKCQSNLFILHSTKKKKSEQRRIQSTALWDYYIPYIAGAIGRFITEYHTVKPSTLVLF